MDWRFVVAGFVVACGFVVGWATSGSLRGAVLAAAFLSLVFAVDWLIDTRLYDL